MQALANRHNHVGQIARVLRMIESRYADNLTMEELAREVNMSVSAFHHHFKAVTATSPLQYIKSFRLHKARMMMLHDGIKAGTAATRSATRATPSSAGSTSASSAVRRRIRPPAFGKASCAS